MPQVLPSITEDQFWQIVEACRRTDDDDLFAFDERLASHLATCDYPTIAGFHNLLQRFCFSYRNSWLSRVTRDAGHDNSSDNSWQRYMGWLVAQGREFFERVNANAEVALERLPPNEDYQNGELVIFTDYKAMRRKSGEELELSDVLADFGYDWYDVTCEPSWRTETVLGLAQAAAEQPTPDGLLVPLRLGILADALEEAGCTNQQMLDHLRDTCPHLVGCWVLKILLAETA